MVIKLDRYTDTVSFIMHIKTDDFYKDISADVDKWFDTSNFNKNDNRPLEIGGKIMTKFVALRAKTYSFLIDEYTDKDYKKNKIVNKKAKGTKKCVVKREILFNILIHYLKIKYCIDHNNDLEVINTFDRVTTYPYGSNVFKVCENEMLLKKNKVMRDQVKHNKDKLKMDDYLSALMDQSKNLRSNIYIYNDKLKSINSKLSMATHTSNFI